MKKELILPKRTVSCVKVEIVGETPLIMHQFGAKSIKMMEEFQAGNAKKDRKRNPQLEAEDSLHTFEFDGETYFGFPATGFKSSMVRAGKLLDYKMTDLRQALFVLPDPRSGELVEIIGKWNVRADMVKVANGAVDIRYRPEFKQWKATIEIEYNDNFINADAVLQLMREASNVGIGEWRGEKNGTFGRWKVTGALNLV